MRPVARAERLIIAQDALTAFRFILKPAETGGFQMPTMSNLRRRKIQNKHAAKREAKIAKKEFNAKKTG